MCLGDGMWREGMLVSHLIPKPYSYYRYFIREYHFHFLGLGISGWVLWVFLWGYWSMGLRLGFFYGGLGVGLWWFHHVALGLGLSVG